MDELRTENKEYLIEIEELRSKLKVKKTKMKYINKQVAELTQQKEVSIFTCISLFHFQKPYLMEFH